jgi:hypothetical protein
MSRWQASAVPPQAESTRIHYHDPKTGETCYRVANWRPNGDFTPNDGSPGIGVDFDPKTGDEVETGKLYPADEFE